MRVRAAAASPERTDVVVEWQAVYEPEACPPLASALADRSPLEESFTAELSIDGEIARPTEMNRLAYSMGSAPPPPQRAMVRATHLLTFPPVPANAQTVELRLRESTSAWTVPVELREAAIVATTLFAEDEHGGVRMRLTEVALYERDLAFGLEVTSELAISAVAAPVPTPPSFSDDDERTRAERAAEMRRVFRPRADPIRLESADGARLEETRREMPPGWRDEVLSTPARYRCAVVFEHASGISAGTLVVPYVDLLDLAPSVDVDLREAPLDLALGEHHFRLAAVERQGDESRLVFELPPTEASPRFMGPARVLSAVSSEFSFHRPDASSGPRMSLRAGDPPVVTLRGIVLRVVGPWRLHFNRSS